jgi:hypothetical protein
MKRKKQRTHPDLDKINLLKESFKSHLINKGLRAYHKLSRSKQAFLDEQFKIWLLEHSVFGIKHLSEDVALSFQCFIAHNTLDRKEFNFKKWAEDKGYIIEEETPKHISL